MFFLRLGAMFYATSPGVMRRPDVHCIGVVGHLSKEV